MSTTQMNLDVSALDGALNQAILQGDILGAFDKYYADDVVMQENTAEPVKGKAENRKREEQFVASIEQFHGGKLLASAVNGGVGFSEWEYDVTFKGGPRTMMNQVAVRHWKNGKVAHERFYYKG